MATNFEPNESVIFVQSTKIGTHENKGIHSKFFQYFYRPESWYTQTGIISDIVIARPSV